MYLRKTFIVILGIINKSVIGKNNALGPSFAALIIYITLIPFAAGLFRKKTFSITKGVASNALSRGNLPKVSLGSNPTPSLGLLYCYKIGGEKIEGMQEDANYFPGSVYLFYFH